MTAVDCGTLTNPVNGQVSHSGGTTFEQTATYVVMQAMVWLETTLALVKLQECGLGVHLYVKVVAQMCACICVLANVCLGICDIFDFLLVMTYYKM